MQFSHFNAVDARRSGNIRCIHDGRKYLPSLRDDANLHYVVLEPDDATGREFTMGEEPDHDL